MEEGEDGSRKSAIWSASAEMVLGGIDELVLLRRPWVRRRNV